MTTEKGFFGELGIALRGTANERLEAAANEGFNDAATICLGVVSKKTDSMMRRIASGDRPSNEELAVLSSLHELKSEMDVALRASEESAFEEIRDPTQPQR